MSERSDDDRDERVSLEKADVPLDFDPYRFGKPEHPIDPRYAPPGYVPPEPAPPPEPTVQQHPQQPYAPPYYGPDYSQRGQQPTDPHQPPWGQAPPPGYPQQPYG